MDIREISEKYAGIGTLLIETEDCLKHIAESKVTIIYLASQHEKKANGKIVYGQCEKIPDKYKWAIPGDFTITIFEPNVEGFTDEQLRTLILHELLHVGINEKDGFYIVPHDVEDFSLIIDRYGRDWSRKVVIDDETLNKMEIDGI